MQLKPAALYRFQENKLYNNKNYLKEALLIFFLKRELNKIWRTTKNL